MEVLKNVQPATVPELHAAGKKFDVTYYNHMLKRLIALGLVEKVSGTMPVKYQAVSTSAPSPQPWR